MTRQQILDSSKLKEFADDNFKFGENGRELSKRVENTVGKGEIARKEQFLLFPQCIKRCLFLRGVKRCHFLPFMENFHPFLLKFELSSANSFNLEDSKIYRLGQG